MLEVGAGKASLDPTDDMYPMPTHFDVCGGRYDSCCCRALAIKAENQQILMISFELSDMPKVADFRKKIADGTGIDEEDILLSVTHNHSSPCDENIFPQPEEILKRCEEYKQIEIDAAVAAGKQALSSLRKAGICYGETKSYINVNRDYLSPGGYWVEAPNYTGVSDKTLSLVKFTDEDGRLIAAILNHCTHATCIYKQKDVDGIKKTSGNFPGIACRWLEQKYKDKPVILWTSGAAGDQNPVLCHGVQLEYPDGYSTQAAYPDGTGYLQMEFIGRRHAIDADEKLCLMEDYQTDISIYHEIKTVNLLRQSIIRNDTEKSEYRMGGFGLRTEQDKVMPPLVPKTRPEPDNPVKVRMELLILGDIAVIGVGAELYCSLGKKLKEASPFRKTFVVTHIDNHVGYVLDEESREHKTFQAFNEVVPGTSEPILLKAEKEMFSHALSHLKS